MDFSIHYVFTGWSDGVMALDSRLKDRVIDSRPIYFSVPISSNLFTRTCHVTKPYKSVSVIVKKGRHPAVGKVTVGPVSLLAMCHRLKCFI